MDRLCSVALFLLPVLLSLYISEASQWWCSRHNCEELLHLSASVWNYYTLLLSSSSSRPTWGQPSLLYNGYQGFLGGKAAGAWRWPSTPSSAEVKERVDLYLYSPSGSLWPVLGWTLDLPFIIIIIIIIIISVIINLFTHWLSNCVHSYLCVCVTHFCLISLLYFFFRLARNVYSKYWWVHVRY